MTHDNIILSKNNNKGFYEVGYYEHVDGLFAFLLAEQNENKVKNIIKTKIQISERFYNGLSQMAIENADLIEKTVAQEINWYDIKENAENYRSTIKKQLGHEGSSDFLKPFVEHSADLYEEWLIYDAMYPNSYSNPFTPVKNLLTDGYTLFASSDLDVLSEYEKTLKVYKDSEFAGNIALVSKTARKSFSGLITDNRYDLQFLVFEFLKNYACGKENAVKFNELAVGLNLTPTQAKTLKNVVLLPLKRNLTIGVCSRGYYFITKSEEILESLNYHFQKLEGIENTLLHILEHLPIHKFSLSELNCYSDNLATNLNNRKKLYDSLHTRINNVSNCFTHIINKNSDNIQIERNADKAVEKNNSINDDVPF
jgi:hypothetical protein